jgi:glycerol-3-phosphate dehydrogenase (NAD(P)+)
MVDKKLHSPIAVLGAGSWGTALALHLAHNKQLVNLWEFDSSQVVALQRDRCNKRYLSGFSFPETINVFGDLEKAVADVQDVLLVVPSHAFRQTLKSLQPLLNDKARILWATKGIDPTSSQLLNEVVTEILGERSMAVLSGPSFAREVVSGLPTAITAASNDKMFADELVGRFNHGSFRVYTSDDLIGVQLGGAVKNVIAIAVGASDGLHYGANARSALITRALAEIMRLGKAMGAKQNTFMGLSGLGDLVLTCTDDQSRNRRLGLAIAAGKSIKDAEAEIGQIVEGAHTAHQIINLAKQHNVDMPICQQVYRILQGKIALKDAVKELLSREPKVESC